MNSSNSTIDRMLHLMNYGLTNESVNSVSQGVIEYKADAADGRTYGIIRENKKFYIKTAPKKNSMLIAEDFDYIGGINNKKNYEYSSYAKASKDLELKLMSINESMGCKKPIVQECNVSHDAEWMVEESLEMQAEIRRQRQIMENASIIMQEDTIPMNTDVPDAPAKNPSEKKVNAPFTEKGKANGDKEFTKTSSDHKKAAPFDKSESVSDNDMESDKNPRGGDAKYTEKAQYVPSNAVAAQSPKGGKAVKMNENKSVRISKEQLLAWNSDMDYMDKSNGTEIGDSAPFTNSVNESEAIVDNGETTSKPSVGVGEIGSDEPFVKNVNEADASEFAGMPDEEGDDVPFPEVDYSDDDLEYRDANMDFEEEFNEWLKYQDEEGDEYGGDEFDEMDMDFDSSYGFDNPFNESVEYVLCLNEDTLDDFGKHPAYRKKPMTLPPNVNHSKHGYVDWNDESVNGEAPFGKQIGDSAPFDDVVDKVTEGVVSRLVMGVKKK